MAERPVRILLRTKTTASDVDSSELYTRELIAGNLQKSLFYKDISGDLLRFIPTNDDATSSINTWSSQKIVEYIDANVFSFDTSWLGELISIESDPDLITPSPIPDEIYMASEDASNGWTPNYIYDWDGTNWNVLAGPLDVGMTCYVNDTYYSYIWDGDKWGEIAYAPIANVTESFYLTPQGIYPFDVSGCNFPDTSNNVWYTEFTYGEAGFWQFSIPSDFDSFKNVNIYFSTLDSTGTYIWELNSSLLDNSSTIELNFDSTSTATTDSIDHTSLRVGTFDDIGNIASSTNVNNLITIKLSLKEAGTDNTGTAYFYSMKMEY